MQVIPQSLKIKQDASSHVQDVHISLVCSSSSPTALCYGRMSPMPITLCFETGGITVKQSFAEKIKTLATSYTS